MPQHQISEYEKEIEKLKDKLQHTESELLVQKSSRTSQITATNQEDVLLSKMEEWKNEQNRRQKEEIGSINDKFLKEIKELNNKNGYLEKIVEDLQAKLGKPSNVNWIKDDVDLTKDMFLQQQAEFEKLRKEFIDYVSNFKKFCFRKFVKILPIL
jgi:molecular chaperone GrpE (heat shock protein)